MVKYKIATRDETHSQVLNLRLAKMFIGNVDTNER